jgi:hypothetical protein
MLDFLNQAGTNLPALSAVFAVVFLLNVIPIFAPPHMDRAFRDQSRRSGLDTPWPRPCRRDRGDMRPRRTRENVAQNIARKAAWR